MHRLVSNYSYKTGQSAPVCSKSHRADSRLACASSGGILVAAAERHPARNVLVRWRLRRKNLPGIRSEFWQILRRTLFLDLSLAAHT